LILFIPATSSVIAIVTVFPKRHPGPWATAHQADRGKYTKLYSLINQTKKLFGITKIPCYGCEGYINIPSPSEEMGQMGRRYNGKEDAGITDHLLLA
jgi:hypothetical protein